MVIFFIYLYRTNIINHNFFDSKTVKALRLKSKMSDNIHKDQYNQKDCDASLKLNFGMKQNTTMFKDLFEFGVTKENYKKRKVSLEQKNKQKPGKFSHCSTSSLNKKNPKKKMFRCGICLKDLQTKQTLNKHYHCHHQIKPECCGYCDKSFSFKSDLNIHMRKHTGEKPFQCEACDKCFTQSGSLTAHMRLHTGEKPFQCEVCDKCFTQSGSLTTHMRLHTGEKAFQCEVCDKRFKRNCSLVNHLKLHLIE